MRKNIQVEGFGKIRSARVSYDGYTVFVGDNNSGKSYLMQLIYAIEKNIKINELSEELTELIQGKMDTDNDFLLNDEDFRLLLSNLNNNLETLKDKIILDTFRKQINIKSLKLDAQLDGHIKVSINDEAENARLPEGLAELLEKNKYNSITVDISNKKNTVWYSEKLQPLVIANMIVRSVFGNDNGIYFPAARAGIQLLYKDFFTARADNQFYNQDKINDEIQLTEPIYDYLRFLHRVEKNKALNSETAKLLEFIENNIVDGKIVLGDNNEVTFSQKNGVENIPLYIVSSMIGEIAPLVEFIQDPIQRNRILIDEIEACLNPKKQREMARLLNRMRNMGISLLISTHSDSMAAYINNLLLASIRRIDDSILREINYENEDLLLDTNINFYEFRNNEDGTSSVEELDVTPYPSTGVEFSMFNENIDKLYRETSKILGVTNEISSA